MKKLIIENGQKFNRLTIIKELELYVFPNGKTDRRFEAICECGNKTIVGLRNIRSEHTKSCGCLSLETSSEIGKQTVKFMIESNIKHGESKSIEYRTWFRIKQRCYNKNNKRYRDWGGRGITVCDRWLNSYENFLEDMGRRPDGYSIDRINNDGNYEHGNCKWSTPIEQANNRRK